MEFQCKSAPVLDIDLIPGELRVLQGAAGEVKIELSGYEDDLKRIAATQTGDEIKLRGFRRTGNYRIMNGVHSREINGVWVETPPLIVTVHLPEGASAVAGSVSEIECSAALDKLRLATSGQGEAKFKSACHLSGKASGQGRVTIERVSGSIDLRSADQCNLTVESFTGDSLECESHGQSHIDVTMTAAPTSPTTNSPELVVTAHSKNQSELTLKGLKEAVLKSAESDGQSTLEISGELVQVRAKSAGQSTLRTRGPVRGDYDANAQGMSTLDHRGKIGGKVNQKKSFMADLVIRS